MRISNTFSALALLLFAFTPCALGDPVANATFVFTKSAKRGLIFIPNSNFPDDNKIWAQSGSDLTWYYNYGPNPSPAMLGNGLGFVPMLYTAPASASDSSFLDTIKSLVSSGTKISHVMSFNEPDGRTNTGGTDLDPKIAAAAWITSLEPLRKMGIKVGAPAVTGAPSGFTWLTSFFSACEGGCNPDFIPIHWYDNFGGLASHMGQVRSAYPHLSMWITEYALANAALTDTQAYFNMTAEYFDRLDYVERYSYFGSFRSSVSNVGPNVTMLDQNGKLTDIGSWYLGSGPTGNVPDPNAKAPGNNGSSSGVALTLKSVWALFVVGVCFCVL